MILLSTFLLSISVTMALIPVFSRLAIRLHALDVPDWRKVHPQPKPRTGGLALAIGTLVSALLGIRSDGFVYAYLIGADEARKREEEKNEGRGTIVTPLA